MFFVTFDKEYASAPLGCEKQRCGGIVKLLAPPKKCFMCGTLTQWVDLGYEAALCSAMCDWVARLDMSRRSED